LKEEPLKQNEHEKKDDGRSEKCRIAAGRQKREEGGMRVGKNESDRKTDKINFA